MKCAFLVLILVPCCILPSVAQNPADTSSRGAERTSTASNEFVSESHKIANLSSANWYYAEVDLNILVRKSQFLGSSAIYKDVFFDGKVGEGYYDGYIDESEIDDAIKTLNYISDSLLIRKPEDKLTYERNFAHSDLKICAVFDPYSNFHARGVWDVYIDLGKTGPQGFVHLRPEEISKLPGVFQTAKEKIKGL